MASIALSALDCISWTVDLVYVLFLCIGYAFNYTEGVTYYRKERLSSTSRYGQSKKASSRS